MQLYYFFPRLVLLIAAVSVLSSTSVAQQIEMPDGEAIVAVNTFSETGAYRLTATRSTIYSSKYTAGAWSKGKQVYMTNPARRIVDAAFKSGEIGDVRTYAVLLENGETLILSFNGLTESLVSTISYPTPTVPQGNSSYRKILLSDDITVQYGSTVYRNKRDGGVWSQDTAGISRLTIADITLDDRDAVHAATNKGVWKFSPTAGNWTRLGVTADTLSISSIFGSRNGRLFAGTSNRSTWVSADRGATWTRDSVGIGTSAITRFGDDAGNTIYAATGGGFGGGGNNSQLYRRTLTGTTWERIDSSLRAFAVSNIQNIRVTDLSGEAGVEVATLFGCYTGANNGDSWAYSTSGIMAEDIYGVQFLGNSTLVSTGLGVFLKQGAAGWTKVFPVVGYSGTRPLIRSDKAGVSYFQLASTGGGGGGGGQIGQIYKSTDNGATWTIDTIGLSTVPTSSGNQLAPVFYADRDGRKSIVNSSGNSAPMRLYSANPNWAIDTSGMKLLFSNQQTQVATSMHTDFTMTNQYVSGAIYNQQFAIQDAILFKRAYSGGAWTADTAGLNKAPVVVVSSDKTNTYCGSAAINGISSIFRKNTGVWEKITSPPSAVSDVRALTVDSNGVLYVAYSGVLTQNAPNRGVYATSDNGATWQYAGLDSVTVRGIVATKDAVYAFTNRGTYKLGLQVLKAASILFNKHDIAFSPTIINTFKDTTITITNSGNDTLRVTSFRAANQQITAFSVIPPQLNLAPGASVDVSVRFAPTTAGIITTTLRSVGNTLPDTIYVTGEGIKPNAEMLVESKQILFDAVTVGMTVDSVIEISNPGTDPLIVTNAASNNPVFTCLPTSFTIAPGGKSTITLTFRPNSAITFNGLILFTTNIGLDTFTVFGIGNPSSVREDIYALSLSMGITPNPSDKEASVRFTLPHHSTVKAELVNTLGEKVSTIFDGELTVGEHNLPLHFMESGVYYLRLITPNGVATMQVVVIQ
ncbi:MAG: choice-of-anchor D domain-containing protein [Ignavibacteria bacterium]|nr:choice-of-anchor D domain-containing protein [Ignavibacteria bacterium]